MGAFGFESGTCADCGAVVAFRPLPGVMAAATTEQRADLREGVAWTGAHLDECTGFVCPTCGNVGVRGPVETSW